MPAIMSGRDVIGVAKTGSGKTVAFLLPMFRHIKDQRKLEVGEGPIAVIMTPTRELAVQIHKECKPFVRALGLRVSPAPHVYLANRCSPRPLSLGNLRIRGIAHLRTNRRDEERSRDRSVYSRSHDRSIDGQLWKGDKPLQGHVHCSR